MCYFFFKLEKSNTTQIDLNKLIKFLGAGAYPGVAEIVAEKARADACLASLLSAIANNDRASAAAACKALREVSSLLALIQSF